MNGNREPAGAVGCNDFRIPVVDEVSIFNGDRILRKDITTEYKGAVAFILRSHCRRDQDDPTREKKPHALFR